MNRSFCLVYTYPAWTEAGQKPGFLFSDNLSLLQEMACTRLTDSQKTESVIFDMSDGKILAMYDGGQRIDCVGSYVTNELYFRAVLTD